MSGCVSGFGQVEIDSAADEIIDHDMFARRTETHRAVVFEDLTGVLQLSEVPLVNFVALALKIRTEIPPTCGPSSHSSPSQRSPS